MFSFLSLVYHKENLLNVKILTKGHQLIKNAKQTLKYKEIKKCKTKFKK